MSMEGIGQPTPSFGIFDHLDHAGGSLRQQYSDRLKIAEACDAAGFRTYPCLDLTRVLDFDLRAYFDNVRHDRLLAKVARRIDDADVMHLLKVNLKPLCAEKHIGTSSPTLPM